MTPDTVNITELFSVATGRVWDVKVSIDMCVMEGLTIVREGLILLTNEGGL